MPMLWHPSPNVAAELVKTTMAVTTTSLWLNVITADAHVTSATKQVQVLYYGKMQSVIPHKQGTHQVAEARAQEQGLVWPGDSVWEEVAEQCGHVWRNEQIPQPLHMRTGAQHQQHFQCVCKCSERVSLPLQSCTQVASGNMKAASMTCKAADALGGLQSVSSWPQC